VLRELLYTLLLAALFEPGIFVLLLLAVDEKPTLGLLDLCEEIFVVVARFLA